MFKQILLITALCVTSIVNAQTTIDDSIFIKKISDNILTAPDAHDNLYHLTKKIGARLAGSNGMYMAENWGTFTLQSLGANEVYLQECKVPHWVRGGTDKFYINVNGDKKKELAVLALGNSLGAGKKGITADVVMVSDLDEMAARANDIKGKIVFVNYKFDDKLINTFDAYSKMGFIRRNAASKAAKYGAAGVVIHSLSSGENNYPHTGAMAYDTNYAKIPAAALGNYDAELLAGHLAKNKKITAQLFTYGYFLPDTTEHNVIAVLKGIEQPEQIITLGGHLDSWDVCEGAHDDGAGIVQTMEVLRAFVALGYKPRHTIRFVLFANEENGLRGGSKYAAEAKAKNEQHIFALESDAGGFTPRGFSFTMSEAQHAKVNTWKNLFAPYGGDKFTSGGGGSDINPLNKIFNTPVCELLPDSQRYFDYHHAANDAFENVNIRELKLGAINMAAMIYLVDKYGL